jgi:DNA replication protein DnaC
MADCQWITRGQHVLITGATGIGKTWLACALGNAALRSGYSVLYRDVPDMLAEWETADARGTLTKLRRRLDRLDLLVLDDWAVEPLSDRDVQALRRVLHDRSSSRSIVLASPKGPAKWRAWLGDYVGDALVDRIEAAAVSIALQGPSLRRSVGR